MLQPRIWLRPSQLQSKCLSLLSRSYATARKAKTLPPAAVQGDPNLFVEGGILLRKYKPRTPGLRHLIRTVNPHLYKGKAYRPLTYARKGHHIGGRNHTGRITMRHRGGGHKRRIRIIDFERMEGGSHTVERIEYDPGRSAHIALVTNIETGIKSYILAAEGMREKDTVQSFRKGVPQQILDSLGSSVREPSMIAAKTAYRGNCLPLAMIPTGTHIFNVGLKKGKGGQLCRSAGTFATMMGDSGIANPKYANFMNVKLQSGEVRRIHKEACATIGVASNVGHGREQLGKAGRSRWLGIRPTVRGLAMNAADHPHGGGRGKSKGNVHPISIWGRTPVSIFSPFPSKSCSKSGLLIPVIL